MKVLIDSSVWIDYLRSGKNSHEINHLLDNNVVYTNELILAELIPPLIFQKEYGLVKLLREINRVPLFIDWNTIIDYQLKCIQNGINKVGIPDLIIAENTIKNNLMLYTLDKHFKLMKPYINLNLF